MPKEEQGIEVELRRIIQADRAAMDIIEGANDTCRYIEKQTKTEVAKILKGAAATSAEINEKALAAENDDFAARQKAMEAKMAEKHAALAKKAKGNGDEWVRDILERITQVRK